MKMPSIRGWRRWLAFGVLSLFLQTACSHTTVNEANPTVEGMAGEMFDEHGMMATTAHWPNHSQKSGQPLPWRKAISSLRKSHFHRYHTKTRRFFNILRLRDLAIKIIQQSRFS